MLSLRRRIMSTDDHRLIKSGMMFIWQIFSKLLLAMNYFDSAIGNGILSVHYQIGGFCRKLGGVH